MSPKTLSAGKPAKPLPEPGTNNSARMKFLRRMIKPLLIFLVVFCVHVTSPNVMIADSGRSIYIASELVHHGDIVLDRYVPNWGGDPFALINQRGHTLPLFPWAPSLFAIPLVMAWDVLHAIGVTESPFDERIAQVGANWPFQVISMSYVVAINAVIIYYISLRLLTELQLRRRRLAALVITFIFAFCTPAWSTASRSLWQHGPSMLLLSVAVLFALRARDGTLATKADQAEPRRGIARYWKPGMGNFLWLGASLAAGFAMRPTNAIPVLFFTLWVATMHTRRIIPYLAGAAPVALGFFAVNRANYGSLLPPYYRGSRLGSSVDGREPDILQALAGNVFSPGRGLFVFTPVLLLALLGTYLKVFSQVPLGLSPKNRKFHSLDVVLVASVFLHWIVISTFAHWWGGNGYGPRLFSDMVPFLVVLCIPALGYIATLTRVPNATHPHWPVLTCTFLLVATSFLIHFQGAYFRSSWCWNNAPVSVDDDPSRLWDWGDPQFTAGFRGFLDGVPGSLNRGIVLESGCPSDSVAG